MSARHAIFAALAAVSFAAGAQAQEQHEHPAHAERHWSFEGLFGTFDRGALQRGFQVYNDVCSTCHSLRQLYYRNLADIGLNEDQVKNIAAAKEIDDGPDDEGKMFTRPGRPSDRFKSPFPNAKAAAFANNGATPPDLSLITKAREGGPNHVFAVLTTYKQPAPPAAGNRCHVEVREGQYYNEGMPDCVIAMPPPLQENAVTYADGTPATLEQEAADVATFLSWAADPDLEARHRLGVKVLLFIFVLTGMMFALKKKIWKDVRH